MSDDYEVGYRKPPQHSRFEKGRSGKPEGRPKGASSCSPVGSDAVSTSQPSSVTSTSSSMRTPMPENRAAPSSQTLGRK